MRIPLDDLALALQRVIDRFVRHLRRGGAPERTHRRLLIVQIEGLSRVVLERGDPAGADHPVQLYKHFIRYQERSPGDAPRTAPQQDRRR